MLIVAPFLCGLIFGAGLLVSGMVQPAKVLAFLDIFGVWDPSLAVVMAAALAVAIPGFMLTSRRGQPISRVKISCRQRRSSMRRFCSGRACSELVGAWLDCVRGRRWRTLRHCRPA